VIRPNSRLRRLLPFLWAVALLCAPGVAYLAGVRQEIFENRAPDGRPPLALSTIGDAKTYAGLDAFVRDRLPFRDDALDLRGRIELFGFGYSASPAILIGEDRWLFYLDEARVCAGSGPVTNPVLAVTYLIGAARASGREATFIPAASKALVERERLDRDDVPETLRCARAFEEDFERRLRANPRVPDLTARLETLTARGVTTFRRWDTHWTTAGNTEFIRTVVDAVEPGLAQRLGVGPRGVERSYQADLTTFLRVKAIEREEIVAPEPGAVGRPSEDVLLVGDSQMGLSMFEEQGSPPRTVQSQGLPGAEYCNWPMLTDGRCDPRLVAAEKVVVQLVMRNVRDLERGCRRAVFAWMQETQGRTAAWDPASTGGTALDGDGSLVPGEGVQSTLRITDAEDDPTRDRIVLLPVSGSPVGARTQVAVPARASGRPEPCSTTDVSAAGETAVLPVGRGRALSDMTFTVNPAPGLRIGAPRIVTLPDPRG
jgi:hypothetical protein